MAELAADRIHDAFKNNDFSAARLGESQEKLDKGIESMRKLVYAFYNEGFSFSQFLNKYPDQRTNIITLLMGNVFKDGVDDIYEPMADFAVIPPPLYEHINGDVVAVEQTSEQPATPGPMSAKYQEYDDRLVMEAGD
jgi:hypothetical protein